jgi:hypothetical protein
MKKTLHFPEQHLKLGKLRFYCFPWPCCWRAARRRCAGNLRSTASIRPPTTGFTSSWWQPDGKVLIGDRFTTVTGEAHNHIARLNPQMSLKRANNGISWWLILTEPLLLTRKGLAQIRAVFGEGFWVKQSRGYPLDDSSATPIL